MPIGNNFQHAPYSRSDPGDRVLYRTAQPGAPPDSAAWLDAMGRLGARLGAAGVRIVVFLHGSLPASDLFGAQRLDEVGGLKRGYSRGIPGMEALLALMRQETNGVPALLHGKTPPFADDETTRTALDEQVRDAGNFTRAYVDTFQKAVNRQASQPIVCHRILWSSEHHHLGRALAARRLLEQLPALCLQQKLGPGDRLLVQAHGHAGQLLALISNLLAPVESSGRRTFLQILSAYGTSEARELEGRIEAGRVLNGAALDVVTFGAAVRYGWDPSGVGRLLHVVNHRPMRADGKRWLAKTELPQITMEMPIAWGGDYVQQLAVAGSDAATPASPAGQSANKALWELLEPYDGFERWLECARKSVRCPADGQCLLVDYQDSTGSTNALDHFYGHAAYSRLSHLLFNTTEIVQALYST
jgi:hypothetical protein